MADTIIMQAMAIPILTLWGLRKQRSRNTSFLSCMLIKPFFPFVSGLADQMDILQHRSPCKQFFNALRVRDESWRVAWASLGSIILKFTPLTSLTASRIFRPRIVRLGRDVVKKKKSKGNYYMIPYCLSNKCWRREGGSKRFYQLGTQIPFPCVAERKDDLLAPIFRAGGDLYGSPGVGA